VLHHLCQKGLSLSGRRIELRGVRVHNLKNIDLEITPRQLVVVCGVSGSGKSSLAIDTLYAEGQRRYIETFSPYTRQFLEQLEKPAADRIDGIPPAIAVSRGPGTRSNRATVGTATEITDYLRVLFARAGTIRCGGCGQLVRRDTPQGVAEQLRSLSPGERFMVAFPSPLFDIGQWKHRLRQLQQQGFVRAVVAGHLIRLDDERTVSALSNHAETAESPDNFALDVIVDRLVAGKASAQRLLESIETGFVQGLGRCRIWVAPTADKSVPDVFTSEAEICEIDGRQWSRRTFSTALRCEKCNREYATPDAKLLNFNSPLGACPTCEGFGSLLGIDIDLVVPDRNKSLREGAIACWNTPAYSHELDELLALATDYGLPVDIPFHELTSDQIQLIQTGVPERDFGGLDGFFQWLEKRKYKMHIRVFLNRWRSHKPCPDCQGNRLCPAALAIELGDSNIADISHLEVRQARQYLRELELADWQRERIRDVLERIDDRLAFLESVGLSYLQLDRTIRTLSGGEAQRVALTSALGSDLVNMLYVLDEPSVGLHPQDVERLLTTVRRLRDRQNTVVVVEHEESFLRAADHLIEIGPEAGERGGHVVFSGPPQAITSCQKSLTGDYLDGRRGVFSVSERRPANRGRVVLHGASGNNLRDITVEFPLGVLCLVTGVSGAGKSTLVQDTLYPAICRRKRKTAPPPLPFSEIVGDGQIDDVVLIDQSPIGRSPRSNPVTYINAFDHIRSVFASTIDARTHNYTAGHFSFNVDRGRCTTCKGDGYLAIDMQFLADVYMKCHQCQGARYRREILEVTYRGRNIAEVLDMTVREAFSFFRGQSKVQEKLKRLIDVGLAYLRLGQPANTLSTGEAQRLKLASYMSATRRNRTLFILDEPTTGLHFADIVKLIDCFDSLLDVGHSLIIVEHNLQMMKAADYLIDLGPGAAAEGGQVVAAGAPEQLAQESASSTGRILAAAFQQ
jgi:excinuclease ABC subunit A